MEDAVFEAVFAAGVVEGPSEDDQAHGGKSAAEDLVEDDVGVGLGLFQGMGDGPVGPAIEPIVDGPGAVAEEEEGHQVSGDAVVSARLGNDGAVVDGLGSDGVGFLGHVENLNKAIAA